jgi:hypothetical protein
MDVSLKNPSELAARLGLSAFDRVLLVDAPESMAELARACRDEKTETRAVEGKAIRTVKESHDGVLLWREDRVGSQALLEAIAKRTQPGGTLWAVVPIRKAMGLSTPAAHRLTFDDLVRAFPPAAWKPDGEVRVSAWHIAYRFRRKS